MALGGAAAWLALTPVLAAAQEPTLGHPVDRFENRQIVGTEGFAALGGSDLKLYRPGLATEGDPATTKNPPELSSSPVAEEDSLSLGSSEVTSAAIEADLATVTGVDGETRPSLKPGLLVAGVGLGNDVCPSQPTGFCLSYLPTGLSGDPASFSDLSEPVTRDLEGVSYEPAANSEVTIEVGEYVEGEGASVALSWVGGSQCGPTDLTCSLNLVRIDVARDGSGDVTGFELLGNGTELGLGSVARDCCAGAFSPFRHAALATGKFTSDQTQLAVAWAPYDGNGGIAYNAAIYDGATTAPGFAARVAPDSVEIGSTSRTSPDLAAAAATVARDHLVIATGAQLQRFVSGASPEGEFNIVNGPVATSGASHLERLGNLDGDSSNREELLAWKSGSLSGIAVIDSFDLNRKWLQLGTSPGDVVDVAVLDARPVSDQVILPDPAQASPQPNPVDVRTAPQILVLNRGAGTAGDTVQLFSFEADGALKDGGSFGGLAGSQRLIPFALDGRIEVADPIQSQSTVLEPTVVVNAPPTHFDILDGQAYDPNFCYAGNQYEVPPVCFFSSQYVREANATTEVTNSTTEDWAVSAEVSVGASILDIAEVTAEVTAGYGEKYENLHLESTTDTVAVAVKALNTDKIYAITRTYDLLEYPIYEAGNGAPSGFLLAATPHTISKRWIDSSSPQAVDLNTNHQPGNILSYPENVSGDENRFISADPLGGPAAFAQDEFELSDSSDYTYELTHERLTDDSASTTRDWNIGATAEVSGESIVDWSVKVSGEYKNSHLVASQTSVGNTTKLTSSFAGIDESFGETAYTVKPFAYWTDTATLVLDYAVEPSTGPPGAPKTWWQLNYGVKPDLTLNLPRLLDYEEQAGISSDAARFISPGVRVMQGPCPPLTQPGLALTDGYTKPNQPLCLSAEVQNYSLKDAPAGTQVQFFDADPDVGGKLIGTVSDVGPIGARESREVRLNWTPDARYAGSRPRIFAVVDSAQVVDEIHEENQKGYRGYLALADAERALHAPTDVIAERSGDSVDVQWSQIPAVADTQPAGHSWLVAAYPDAGGAPIAVTVDGTEEGATLPDLDPGRYRVAVKAVLGSDSSPASHPSEPVDLPAGAPGAPTNVEGVAGNASVQLSWDPPAETGGVPVKSYRVAEYRDAGQNFPAAPVEAEVSGETTGLTITGLTNGRPYRFTVRAVTEAGPGASSDPSAAVTPRDTPRRPTEVEATGETGGKASVNWVPPDASAANAAVTGYEVTASPGGATRVAGQDVTSLSFEGLTPGVAYTFTVRANSAVGFGPESLPSSPATPADAPAPPENVQAGVGTSPGSVRLDWEAPEQTGGVPLESYHACLSGAECKRVGAPSTEVTFTGLAPGVEHEFEVTARNEAGLVSAPATARNSVMLEGPPGVRFTKVPDEGSYTAAATTIAFEVAPSSAATECEIDGRFEPCASPLRLSGLDNGSHSIRVRAHTSSGGSTATELVTWQVDADAPQASISGLRALTLRKVQSFRYGATDAGGSGVTGYQVRARGAGAVGGFSEFETIAEPIVSTPEGAENDRGNSTVPVGREGRTVCASVRSVDGAGNHSAWTKERCTTRPYDESALKSRGKWRRVSGNGFSDGHALEARRPGPALEVRMSRTRTVRVLADRCRACGRIGLETRGRRQQTIDLGRRHTGSVYKVKLPASRHGGRVRLVSLGGGPVRIDGFAVLRRP